MDVLDGQWPKDNEVGRVAGVVLERQLPGSQRVRRHETCADLEEPRRARVTGHRKENRRVAMDASRRVRSRARMRP